MDIEHTKYLLSDLATDLTLYSEIYGPEDSVSVLNKFNGFVFGRLQFCLIERILLGFARFMDPAESRVKGGINENLSLKNLIRNYNLENDDVISKKFNEIENMYQSANIKNYRNTLISHNDKNTKLGLTKVNFFITPNNAHKMLSCMMNLVNEIADKTGKKLKNIEENSYISFPQNKGGIAFIAKLKNRITSR